MNDTLQYRNATSADTPQLKELGWLAYSQYTPLMTAEHATQMHTNIYSDEMWKKILEQGTGFVAELDGIITGMAFIIPSGNESEIFSTEWAHIRMVGVHPAHQGRGIARHLMHLCIDHARANGEKILALHTSEPMEAARYIYAQMGFTAHHDIPDRMGLKYKVYTLEL